MVPASFAVDVIMKGYKVTVDAVAGACLLSAGFLALTYMRSLDEAIAPGAVTVAVASSVAPEHEHEVSISKEPSSKQEDIHATTEYDALVE